MLFAVDPTWGPWEVAFLLGRIAVLAGLTCWLIARIITALPLPDHTGDGETADPTWDLTVKKPLEVENEEPYLFTDIQRMPSLDEPRRRISRRREDA